MRTLAYDHPSGIYSPHAQNSIAPQQTRLENSASYIRLDIKWDTFKALLSKKQLVVEDLRGLDQATKRHIRQLLLDNLLASTS